MRWICCGCQVFALTSWWFTTAILGPAPPRLQYSDNRQFTGVHSSIASLQRHSWSRLVHSHGHLYRSKSASTSLYPCTSPSHRSAPVTSHRTHFWLHPVTSCKACLCPFFLPLQTRKLLAPHSLAPHVGSTSNISDWLSLIFLRPTLRITSQGWLGLNQLV